MSSRAKLRSITVYAKDEAQAQVLQKAADLDNRSLSNFLIHLGMTRADELGVTIKGKAKQRKVASR